MHKQIALLADDGEPLHVSITGKGSPLLLLHGWTASHAAWSPLLEQLSQRHQLIRPDARGHGGHSLSVTQTPDVARLARDVLNLLDHLGIAQATIAGHSMGALTLWQFIRDFGTSRLANICLLDQSPKLVTDMQWRMGIYGAFSGEDSGQLIDDLTKDWPDSVLRLVANGLNDKARSTYLRNTSGWRAMRLELSRYDPGPLIAIWKSLVAADFRDVLPRIDVPTLLVYGCQSNFYTMDTARYVAARISGSVLHLYEDADHCPHLLQPQRFLEDFEAFTRPIMH
jgi:pimeloyl-ACP methyl ester carboxylesterase